jgi:hypothetical protein
MALLAPAPARAENTVFKVGSFTTRTTTAAYNVPHNLGLTTAPKAVIFWATWEADELGGNDMIFTMGIADNALNQKTVGVGSDNSLSTSDTRDVFHGGRILTFPNFVSPFDFPVGVLNSMDATNFNVSWNPADTQATVIHYLAMGGTQLRSKVVQWNTRTTTGTQAVTGIGFKPNVVIHFYTGSIEGTGVAFETATGGGLGMGVMDFAGNEWANQIAASDADTSQAAKRVQVYDASILAMRTTTAGAETQIARANMQSMDIDGFTMNFTAATNGGDVKVISLALQGLNTHASSFTKTTNTTTPLTQAVTGVSFAPTVVLLSSVQDFSSTTINDHGYYGFGAAASNGGIAMGSIAGSIGHCTTTCITTARRWSKTSQVFVSQNSNALNIDAEGTLQSFNSNGFTINWTDNSGGFATQIAYLALSSPSSTAVKLDAFGARLLGQGIDFRWRTGYELNSLGFRIYQDQAGSPVLLTPSLIGGSALLLGANTALGAGRSYQWLAPAAAQARGGSYWLEEIDLRGDSTFYGPVTAQPAAGPDPAVKVIPSSLLIDVGRRAGSPDHAFASGPGLNVVNWRSPRRPPAPRWTPADKPAIKIGVARDGFYRLSAGALFAAGLDRNMDPQLLTLASEGEEVALRVNGEQDGRLDDADSIEFYGTALDTPYSGARVYWLGLAATRPRRMGLAPTSTGSLAPAQSFPFTVEQKERSVYFAALLNGDDQNFFGESVSRKPVVRALGVHHLAPGATEATLHARLQGVSATAHRIAISLNGQPLSTIEWAGRDNREFEVPLPVGPAGLVEGENIFTFNSGSDPDVALLDTLRLSYPHAPVADDDAQRLLVAAGEAPTIGGFSDFNVRAFDVTDPRQVLELPVALDPAAAGAEVSASLLSPAASARTVLFLGERRIETTAALSADRPSAWGSALQGADMVIITHGSLAEAAEPLRKLREEQGRRVLVVDVEDIYDEFNFGHKSPYAIRHFLETTQKGWSPRPHYLLLLGDASLDPRNYTGAGDNDLLPTKLVDTSLLETASDDWFADFADTGLATMAIGRIPARTADEALRIIEKLVAHERTGDQGQSSVLIYADTGSDPDFTQAARDAESAIPPGWSIDRRSRQGSADIVALLNKGPLLVDYIGHGSVDVWRDSLNGESALALKNGNRLSMVVSLTCLNGFFQDARLKTLAEALLAAPSGGAFAVWTSSGFTRFLEQPALNERFLQAVLSEQLPLGDAALAAKAAVDDLDLRRTWILFGDPSRTLPPPPPVETDSGWACTLSGRGGAGPLFVLLATAGLSLAWIRRIRRQRPGTP